MKFYRGQPEFVITKASRFVKSDPSFQRGAQCSGPLVFPRTWKRNRSGFDKVERSNFHKPRKKTKGHNTIAPLQTPLGVEAHNELYVNQIQYHDQQHRAKFLRRNILLPFTNEDVDIRIRASRASSRYELEASSKKKRPHLHRTTVDAFKSCSQ